MANSSRAASLISVPSKFGGTTFLDTIELTQLPPPEGAPNRGLLSASQVQALLGWRHRIHSSFGDYPDHKAYWITLTYARRPASPADWKRDGKRYIKRLASYFRNVRCKAQRILAERGQAEVAADEKIHYIMVQEKGGQYGREHFHVLLFTPYSIDFERPQTKWSLGLQKVVRCGRSAKDRNRLARYLTSYATKEIIGIPTCSYNFGLTRTTMLLSLSRWQQLHLIHPALSRRLLQRLLLSPSLIPFRMMDSLILQDSSLIGFPPINLPPAQLQTGDQNFSLQQDQKINYVPPGTLVSENLCRFGKAAAKAVLEELRTYSTGDVDAIGQDVLQHPTATFGIPGLRCFGRPRPISRPTKLEASTGSAVWKQSQAGRRRVLAGSRREVRLGESRSATISTATYEVWSSPEPECL